MRGEKIYLDFYLIGCCNIGEVFFLLGIFNEKLVNDLGAQFDLTIDNYF
jgi:hypothetical protein